MSIPHIFSSDLMKTAFLTALCRQYGEKILGTADDIVVEPNPDRKGRVICFTRSALVAGKISVVRSRLAVSLFESSWGAPAKPIRIATYRFDDDDIPDLSTRLTAIRALGTFAGILLFPLEMTARVAELCEDVISLSCMVPDVAMAAISRGMDGILSGIAIPEPLDGILAAAAEFACDVSEAFVPKWVRDIVAESFEPLLSLAGLTRFGTF